MVEEGRRIKILKVFEGNSSPYPVTNRVSIPLGPRYGVPFQQGQSVAAIKRCGCLQIADKGSGSWVKEHTTSKSPKQCKNHCSLSGITS